jgi:16S rRNA (guanine1207-N2)-methyltransferase
MEFILNVPQGKFQIRRIPLRQNELLQAWDAADEYLLNFAEHLNLNYDSKVCILNDSFGALAVALHHHRPIAISDSFLSHLATQHNLDLNGINRNSIELQNSLWLPTVKIDFLFIKIPKTLALLEYQLYRFREWLKPECKVIVAGMIKNLPKSTWQILASILGPTTTSLAVKKSRLIFAEIDNRGCKPKPPKIPTVFSKLVIPVKKPPIFIANRPLAMVDFIAVDRKVSTHCTCPHLQSSYSYC